MMSLVTMAGMTIVAVFLSQWLARRGLVRLEGMVDRKLLALGATGGGLAGLLWYALMLWSGDEFTPHLTLHIPYMTLLMTAASVDLTTHRAPVELMVPIASLTPVLAARCPVETVMGVLLCAGGGAMIYLAARLAWGFQRRINCLQLPPADLVMLLLPIILFGAGLVPGLYYMLLFVVLLAIRWFDSTGLPGIREGDTRIPVPLLALACPQLVLFMIGAAVPWSRFVP